VRNLTFHVPDCIPDASAALLKGVGGSVQQPASEGGLHVVPARRAEEDEPKGYPVAAVDDEARGVVDLPLVPAHGQPLGRERVRPRHGFGGRVAVDLKLVHDACGVGEVREGDPHGWRDGILLLQGRGHQKTTGDSESEN